MRLKNLLSIGVALFFVMLVAHGEVSSSDGSSGRAVVLLIDYSSSTKEYDHLGEAKNYTIGLNNSTDVVWLVSKTCYHPVTGKCEFVDINITQDYTYIDEFFKVELKYNARDSRFNELLDYSILLLNNIGNSCNKTIVFISDGEPSPDDSDSYTPPSDPNSSVVKAKNAGIRIDARCLGDDLSACKNLEIMCRETGGNCTKPANPVDIASISVNKTSDISSGSNGTLVNFTINVTNSGKVTLNPVVVTDTLPGGLDYVGSTDEGHNSNNNVTWDLGMLNESDSRLVYLEARINSSESGVLINFVSVEGKPESGYSVSAYTSSNVTVRPPNGTFIVFALDTSGSMKKYYRLAPNDSAEIVSTWSHFGNVTVSIVSWDHDSDLLFGPAPLVGNEARLAEILDNLSEMCIETDLTYYDEGLNGSLAVLRDYADGANDSAKIIVFLTGFSEFEPGNRLDEYISEAKESGCKIFTIGLGIERNFSASEKQYLYLTKISEGTGGEFQAAPAFSSGELKTVMETIAKGVEILGIPEEPRSG